MSLTVYVTKAEEVRGSERDDEGRHGGREDDASEFNREFRADDVNPDSSSVQETCSL